MTAEYDLSKMESGKNSYAQIQEGLAQAQRGEFVSDEGMEAFFVRFSEPQAT